MHNYTNIIKEQAKLHNINIYMVGGAVRNNILGIPVCDYDFALDGNCHSFGISIAKMLGASYVFMHENVARVVKENIIFDFSRIVGNTLEDDLRNRDFTINAMAMDISNGQIIDITGGRLDIENKIIRHNCETVFISDPVRMLRAVRLSAQLRFAICGETKDLIKKNSGFLISGAGERILEEIFKITDIEDSYRYIEMLDYLGLLDVIFPIIKRMKTIGKCKYHVVNSYAHSLLTLRYLEKNIDDIYDSEYGYRLKEYLNSDVNSKRRIQVIKLAALLHDIGKPDAMHMEGERVSFRGHDVTGEAAFKEITLRIPFSIKQSEIILSVIKGHMRVLSMYKHGSSDRAIYKFFKDFQGNSIDVLLCSLCDVNATRSLLEDNGEGKKYWCFVMSLIERCYTSFENKQKFVSGKDVMQIRRINGAIVGRILNLIDEQCFCGLIKSRQDAVDFIMNVEIDNIM